MKVYITGPIMTDLKYYEKFKYAEAKVKRCGSKYARATRGYIYIQE